MIFDRTYDWENKTVIMTPILATEEDNYNQSIEYKHERYVTKENKVDLEMTASSSIFASKGMHTASWAQQIKHMYNISVHKWLRLWGAGRVLDLHGRIVKIFEIELPVHGAMHPA